MKPATQQHQSAGLRFADPIGEPRNEREFAAQMSEQTANSQQHGCTGACVESDNDCNCRIAARRSAWRDEDEGAASVLDAAAEFVDRWLPRLVVLALLVAVAGFLYAVAGGGR